MDNKLFQVSIKGLIIKENKILLLHEKKDTWDLPGGRLQHGESFEQTLERECEEEMGVKCEVLDKQPTFSWIAEDSIGNWRVMLCFRIKLEHFNFRYSDECIGYDFFNKSTINTINVVPQIKRLKEFLQS
ncbi:MAG: hypothetical protein A3B91_01580 [Candidatus Yanofskybacteria bacterium RIFCSPHIGHO2_02_FULL_41_29]|uniref:Nudix hydrolase domain-containing protein n=1 Tax=Candidatus Yanofskybacteria bacterium RIFCSPHIGHO2_01_FULL_41_53 TaxID=1802663 RepID=A0A1F8EH63_9BACT|nr:MAG: hypothetical protein A2650_01000 [Candidatus Yanofskybacteria bacterium RIFCSPHIGHO2_01_FULL_41_53]OGN11057.1 MAG: hypothetical protein A3B91_01580 [Candidatus Yanofskybacteria bacterium RIFCSPHIGHO2_02_FULL_41_29]OGN19072.1 MAG: hypothetical protein A3F48_01350 [Candidatus Yanofskybacteria bacterium RIFCSPHIGHO2_12_FULL_41_9]OGN30249.1 MAG: hypothetical protein A3H54_02705 [Candidatus Yanofskybacteria bacterium RIFCSPLOWO2_02_FULL_41_13]OGN33778.1 MAG: hypothetical protein A3F98_02160 